jgi:hypothetical protein
MGDAGNGDDAAAPRPPSRLDAGDVRGKLGSLIFIGRSGLEVANRFSYLNRG